MIFIDTSVWVEFFRAQNQRIVAEINKLIDTDTVALAAPVWVELLCGASEKNLGMLRQCLSALPRFYPTAEAWDVLESWIPLAAHKGERFGVADLLIASIVFEQQGTLWSLDNDFSRMQNLNLIKLYNFVRSA